MLILKPYLKAPFFTCLFSSRVSERGKRHMTLGTDGKTNKKAPAVIVLSGPN